MHSFFYNILCIFFTLIFHLHHSVFAASGSTELPTDETFYSCFETPLSFLSFSKESERINFQIERYDQLYLDSPIANRDDFLNKNISGFIEIAFLGIRYTQHYYQQKLYSTIKDLRAEDQSVILEQCVALAIELDKFITTKKKSQLSAGMTPAEFMSFNFKLATLQTITPSIYSAFRRDQESYDVLLLHPFHDVHFWMDQQERPAFSPSAEEGTFFCTPYIIYTPKGAFSIHRLMRNILLPQHHHSLLMGLPIGLIDIHNSPHNQYYRDPLEFINHDYQHAMIFFGRKRSFDEFKMKWGSSYKIIDLSNPCIELAAFYAFHEDALILHTTFSDLLLQYSEGDESPLETLHHTKILTIKEYLSFYDCKHGRRKLSSITNYQLELKTVIQALALANQIPKDKISDYSLQKEQDFQAELYEMYKKRQGKDFEEIFNSCNYYWNAFANYLRYEVALIVDKHIKEATKKVA